MAAARQQAHACHVIPMTTDKPDLVWSSECKPRRAVTGQTLPLPLFYGDFGSFSETNINVGVRVLPSHMKLDDINSLMSLTRANVGHACVVEHYSSQHCPLKAAWGV